MTDVNRLLFERAVRVIPGGVNSPVRAFGSVGGTPYFVERADGPYVWDADGKRYIDYVQSYGPGILGHAHPAVLESITRAASNGTSYGAPTEAEVVLAEMVVDRIVGLESVRFVSSGTEATMSAIRLARGATGRSGIVKFAGCYHGHGDALLAAGGSGVANQGLTGCDGVTAGAVADTIVGPYNVLPDLDDTVAAVIVEPVAANMGLIAPAPGFLEGLRLACDAVGALLVFDEVITGFRLARGGAAERFGVTPDLWCFGKVIGGGLPVGAFGGRWDVMEHLAPLGGVYQGGTLSGNPLAMAAGRTTLELLDDGAFDRLAATTARLAAGLAGAFTAAGLDAVLPRVGSLLGIYFGEVAPSNFDEAKALAENGLYPMVFHALLERGVALAPGAYEAMFPSLAHSDAVVDETAEVAGAAAKAVVANL
ncbi:MAG: glutamate-1-semialdehyde 2,1-aminomutase [Actinomycetota bacterium]|mgnify:FL=1|nr:glutamate-1-semialdehyde 2,1-aminomutase [Acidimicrobiales bacterium]MEC8815299.1 glutamate-1-semialdehyde 2,1-aminomutase [Actinomycetota bacterium]MEC8969966.1 glutamate-1-semialdehyde 2,1-aminomutase [Actinomycetota bacterium]MEE3205175.1 glutamate-1-semialdehyde 2,1-aminomutase [Actinomycetota bacterium]